jgi:signal transduction histidine kinase
MTLRARLAVGLIAIAAVLVVPLVIALRALGSVHSTTRQLQAEAVAGSMSLRRVQSMVDDARLAEDALLFVHDQLSLTRMRAATTGLERAADSLRVYGLDRQAGEIREGAHALGEAASVVYEAAVAGRAEEAERAADEQMRLAIAKIDLAVHEAERALQARTHETVAAAGDAASDARRLAVSAMILALLAGAALALWLIRSISRPVHELDRGMRIVAGGDFDHQLALDQTRRDEFGRLAASFGTMTHQLSELDRMKSEFVSIASHELKTPINVIIGYVQLLEDGIYGKLEPKQADACRTVERQARALDRLVRRLLDVSRFEAGAVNLDLDKVDPRQLVNDVRSDFAVMADQRGIHLDVTIGDGTPREATWDADRVRELLGNLVSNALNFTERGGRVTVSVDPNEDDAVRLAVSDTGVGISPEQLPHVFQKFYQARNQASARAKGTGLGLAIVKEIVEAHGGTISADSALGRGTQFVIVMPVHAVSESQDVQKESQTVEAMA